MTGRIDQKHIWDKIPVEQPVHSMQTKWEEQRPTSPAVQAANQKRNIENLKKKNFFPEV